LDNLQIESSINEIRKRSGTVTAFNKNKILLNQKDEDLSFIIEINKNCTIERDKIKTLCTHKLYPNSSYPLCGDYNLTKISLKQKDENMQEVSRPTAHLQQNHANGVVYVS